MNKKLVELSKVISYALRHEPWVFELELNDSGWVNVEALILAIKLYEANFTDISKEQIQTIIDESAEKRFEIKGENIRAIYGHSIPGKLLKEPAVPPQLLYHGTTIEIAELINKGSIKPMQRQYVHLSVDIATAKEVAKRKGKSITILAISAQKAHQEGIRFYSGNEHVLLSDSIPSKYIDFNFNS